MQHPKVSSSSMRRRRFLRRVTALAGCFPPLAVTSAFSAQLTSPVSPTAQLVGPTTKTKRVALDEGATDGPNWELANRSLSIAWRHPGGDWIDARDAQNGATPHATVAITGIDPPAAEVTTLVQRLLLENTAIMLHMQNGATAPALMSRRSSRPPSLLLVTDAGEFECPCIANCWIDPTSNRTIGNAPGDDPLLRPPAFLKFDLTQVRGTLQHASLTLALTRWYGPASIAIDYLDMPKLITDPANEIGDVRRGLASTVASDRHLAAHPEIVFYSECSSEAAIRSKWSYVSPNYPGGHVCINPRFVQWPEVALTALRMESQSPTNRIPGDGGSSILTWRAYPAPGHRYAELYVRYMLRIDPDVFVGMNELGVKLPGMEGDGFSYRMEHGRQSPANPNVFRLVIYAYDATRSFDDPNRGSLDRKTSVCLRAGQLYSIEQHVQVNTIGANGVPNPDGIIEIFVDGVLVYADPSAKVTTTAGAAITSMPFANFFHGGAGVPKAAMHYEFSGIAVAKRYIGPPVRSAAWRSPR